MAPPPFALPPPVRPEPVEGPVPSLSKPDSRQCDRLPPPLDPREVAGCPANRGSRHRLRRPQALFQQFASARSAKAHMFASRSGLPVSSVTARSTAPDTAKQACPASSPYRFPVGPLAPVSAMPQSAPIFSRTVLGNQRRVRLRASPHPDARHVVLGYPKQRHPRHPRIRHNPPNVIGRSPRHRKQRSGNKPPGRGISHRNLLSALLQQCAHRLRKWGQGLAFLILLNDCVPHRKRRSLPPMGEGQDGGAPFTPSATLAAPTHPQPHVVPTKAGTPTRSSLPLVPTRRSCEG